MGKENRGYNINPSTEQNRPAGFVSSHGIFPAVDVNLVVILEKNNRLRRPSPQVQEARDLVLRASQEGYLDRLTGTQRPVIEERYLREKGIVVSFKLVQERLGINVTRSALHLAHRNGIERLKRVKKGQPPVEKRVLPRLGIDMVKAKILFKAGYTKEEVARELNCSVATLNSRNREHGIILKKGRPIKHVPGVDPESLKTLYWEEGLSLREISQLLGDLTVNTIWRRMVKFGIERRWQGRPKKS